MSPAPQDALRHVRRVSAPGAAVIVASLLLSLGANALTIKTTYQARYGPNGTVTLRQFTNGSGAVVVSMSALVPGRSYAFRFAVGSCTASTASSIPSKAMKVSSTGKLGTTWTLSTSQVHSIASKLSAARVVAVLTAGSSRLCRTLSPAGPSRPSPSPTPGPGGGVSANVSPHKFGYGPTLTPAMMSDWLPALRLGVPATVTATVTAGQNVYALFVVPPGGSLTFKVTTSSTSGGWYWQWNRADNYWITPELYFYEGQFVTVSSGTTWAFGLDLNTYSGSETLTITPTAITRP